MSFRERPPAKGYFVRNKKMQQRVWHGGVYIWVCDWILYQVNADSLVGLHYRIADLTTPCRSNLYKFLVGLLHDWNWHFEGDVQVTPEQAKYLEVIFNHQKEYKFWAEGLKIVSQKGKEEAWKWIEEKIPLLKLKDKIGSGSGE